MLAATLHTHEIRMQRARRFVEESLDEVLALDAIASSVGMSVNQFDRVFTRRWGESPRALQRRLRLERAAQQLRSSTATVLQIALSAGYESHEAFTRAFSQRYGQTPRAFRRSRVSGMRPVDREMGWRHALLVGLRARVESSQLSAIHRNNN